MSYFFADTHLVPGEDIVISGDEAHHLLHARRIRIGESVKLQGPDGRRCTGIIRELGRRTVDVHIEREIKVPREPRVHIHLFQACTKEKTIDIILQKGTELGVEKVLFFQSANSPQQLTDGKEEKLERWNSIALEAAKQCDRAAWPAIEIIDGEEELEKRIASMNHFYIVDAKGRKSLSHMASEIPKLLGLKIGICIGPEGGLSESELALFTKATNATVAHLGPRILRASTAAPVAVAIIQSVLGDMQ